MFPFLEIAIVAYFPWEQIVAWYLLVNFGLGLALSIWGVTRKERA